MLVEEAVGGDDPSDRRDERARLICGIWGLNLGLVLAARCGGEQERERRPVVFPPEERAGESEEWIEME